MKEIVVTTPARLHFGLIDMNGELGRIDGGVGLSLISPHTKITASKNKGIEIQCPNEPAIIDCLKAAL